jgi:lipopolysaccharide cholinephosphotransferase
MFKIKNTVIYTKKGEFYFKPQPLYFGRSRLVEKIAFENLLLFKNILTANNIKFGLLYGTLLGAVRENKLIPHDEDVDVYIFHEDLEDFLVLLYDFKILGFSVVRYNNDMLTIMRNNNSIDISIFKKEKNYRRSYNVRLPCKVLEELVQLDFYNNTFWVPKNYVTFLEKAYGPTWRVPIPEKYSELGTGNQLIKRKIAKILPKRINYLIALTLIIFRN